jgi:RNA polymerase sigma factor (sigma-70 family)
MELEQLVQQATNGDKVALAGVITAVQDEIYYLALRMLANTEDAKDATQEILINLITKLSTFEFKSSFKTWVYRVATNYLLNNKKLRIKDSGLSFEMYKADLEVDLESPGELKNMPEYPVLVNELRIACTMAMLLCLNRSHRLAYILGEIFDLEHGEASEILSMSRENYRKQLSRAREKVTSFTKASCGLVADDAQCNCEWKLKGGMRRGRIHQGQKIFSETSKFNYVEVQKKIKETQEALKTIVLQNAVTCYKSPIKFGDYIEELMAESDYII